MNAGGTPVYSQTIPGRALLASTALIIKGIWKDRTVARRTKPPDYHRDLARRIKLIDGTELRTLNDVAEFFYEHFEPGRKWPTLKEAGKLLLRAARSGKVDKIEAATHQIEDVLRMRRLLS